jgi:predicted DNA-binding transcriptional regulator YafY
MEGLGPRIRIVRLLRTIIEQPYRYTKQQLATMYNKNIGTIKGDFQALADAGFCLDYDSKGRYAFVTDKPLAKLENLLHFSKEDQVLLYQAIDNIPGNTERHQQLKAKLAALYDFRQLGLSYLRKPHLTKVDLLLEAKEKKVCVVLEGYRSSNSNTVTDRIVEPFHVSPPDDTLQAFDVEKKQLRHFRISRIMRVKPTTDAWQHEGWHNIMRTDVFRIVDNEQIMVHLKIGVAAYNELIERYPLSKSYIEPTDDPNIFDFQCMVNHRFFALSNFIFGYYHLGMEIVGPDSLISFLNAERKRFNF